MSCCGCFDEESKVTPSAQQHRNAMSTRQSDEIFVKDRSCTDLISLLIFIALVGGYAFMMHNAVKQGDIYRIIYGYDDCANVCGRVTLPEADPQFQCKGKDFRDKPYLRVSGGIVPGGVKEKKCVASCSSTDQIVFLNRCVAKEIAGTVNNFISTLGLDNFYKNVSSDLQIAWRELIYLILIALAFSLSMLIAFRYLIRWIVYIVLIGVIVVCVGGTVYLWMAWYNEKKAVKENRISEEESSVEPYFVYAILISIVTVITILIVLVMRKRIALVIQLFREAGKAIYDMPALLLQPIYTYLMIGVITASWIYAMLWIESAGDLYKKHNNHLHYKKDALLVATRWYNIFFYFVLCEFVIGCQHMVVALSVARWFFKRDKSRLFLTVTRAFYYLVRYHLGTVAFGALVIGIVRIIRAMIAFVQKTLKKFDNTYVQAIGVCCQCCFYCFEVALKFFTRNAYIETEKARTATSLGSYHHCRFGSFPGFSLFHLHLRDDHRFHIHLLLRGLLEK